MANKFIETLNICHHFLSHIQLVIEVVIKFYIQNNFIQNSKFIFRHLPPQVLSINKQLGLGVFWKLRATLPEFE
jgi:hypothetical protein